jgi:transposase-like protein
VEATVSVVTVEQKREIVELYWTGQYTQEELARKVGVHRTAVSKWTYGHGLTADFLTEPTRSDSELARVRAEVGRVADPIAVFLMVALLCPDEVLERPPQPYRELVGASA